MAFIRNDSETPQRGPYFIIKPGQVVEVEDGWIRSRDDRVRRGHFTIVDKPEPVKVEEPKPAPEPKKAKAKPAIKKEEPKK